jgi:hypothetical protein
MIAFAGEQRFGFQVRDVNVCGAEFAVQFFQQIVFLLGIGFFPRQMDVSFEIAGQRGESFVCGNLLFGALPFTEDALRRFLIVPETGVGDAGFESLKAFTVAFGVKDNSGRA